MAESCWNGLARLKDLEMSCCGEERVTSVEEPDRCSYLMKSGTSAACKQEIVSALHAELETDETGKDEL